MALIRIEEKTTPGPDGTNATLSFEHGPKYDITVIDPFTPQEEEALAWYFEEHMRYPMLKRKRAEKAAASVATYGEKLFAQVFADPDARTEYLQALVVRKNLRPQAVPAAQRSAPTIHLLIVVARPRGGRDVGYRTISRPLVEALRNANVPVKIDILRPGTYKALAQHLQAITNTHGEGYYHAIHFDVHGSVMTYQDFQRKEPVNTPYQYVRFGRSEIKAYEGSKAFLAFDPAGDEAEPVGARQADLVEAAELAQLLALHQIPIALLNACQSGQQVGERETSLGSRLIAEGVQLVLAMGYSVTVNAACGARSPDARAIGANRIVDEFVPGNWTDGLILHETSMLQQGAGKQRPMCIKLRFDELVL